MISPLTQCRTTSYVLGAAMSAAICPPPPPMKISFRFLREVPGFVSVFRVDN